MLVLKNVSENLFLKLDLYRSAPCSELIALIEFYIIFAIFQPYIMAACIFVLSVQLYYKK